MQIQSKNQRVRHLAERKSRSKCCRQGVNVVRFHGQHSAAPRLVSALHLKSACCNTAAAFCLRERSQRAAAVPVGLSNILDSELIRRKPAKRSHGEVVGTAIMDSE